MHRPKSRRLRRNRALCRALAIASAFLVVVLLFRASGRKGTKEESLAHEYELGTGGVSRDDLLVAFPTFESHLPLVRASRRWRKGIRTLIAVNDTRLAAELAAEGREWNETWVFYPDDAPLRANYPGDTRAAVVPFLAHQLIGRRYKWLLYGDDDTQWFVEGALALARELDPALPYFVTDNLWWSSVNGTIGSQPNLEAPRCLPCGYHTYGWQPAGEMQFPAPEGCPCTPALLCAAAAGRQLFDPDCSIPRHLAPGFSSRTYSMHGGAGGLLSAGLLRRVPLRQMEACIERAGSSTGGDSFITICLWQLGLAHTDPGPYFNDPQMRLFDAAAWLGSSQMAVRMRAAAHGQCEDRQCELFDRMVSSHVHSRKAGSVLAAADAVSQLSEAYDYYTAHRAVAH